MTERERDEDEAVRRTEDDVPQSEEDAGVDEASDESFPASDPPSSQPLHPGGPDADAHARRGPDGSSSGPRATPSAA